MKVRSLFGVAALLFTATAISAATVSWTGTDDGNFSNFLNWSGGNTPSPGDDLVFDINGSGNQMFLDQDFTAKTLNFSSYNYTFVDVASYTLTITNGITDTAGTTTIDVPIAVSATIAINVSGGDTLIFEGGIIGTGGFQLLGGGTVTLQGINTYTGSTLVSNGTLLDNGANSFSPHSQLLVDSSGVVNIASSQTVPTVTDSGGGHGAVGLGSGVTLTLTGTNSDTFSGVISGPGGIDQAGVSTWTLTGANTYTGPTTIETGAAISVGSGGSTGSLATGSVSGSGILEFDLSGTPAPFTGDLSGTLSVVILGSGVVRLSGDNANTGVFTVSSGTLQAGSNTAFGNAVGNTFMTVASGATLDLNGFDNEIGALEGGGTVTLGSGQLTLFNNSSLAIFSGTITGSGGTLVMNGLSEELTGGSTYSGGTTINEGTLIADNTVGSATGTGPITITTNGVLQIGDSFDSAGSVNGASAITDDGLLSFVRADTVTFANSISGTGAVTINGGGTGIYTFSGTNTYSGTTSVNNATFKAGGASSLGNNSDFTLVNSTLDLNGHNVSLGSISSTASSTIALGANTLTFTDSDFSSVGSPITGSGGLVLNGSGEFAITGAASYTGGTTIGSSGYLSLGLNSMPGASMVGNVADNGQFQIAPYSAENITLNGAITGTGMVRIEGAGIVTLGNSGGNTYSGITDLNMSTLTDSAPNAFSPMSNVYISSGGTLAVTQNETVGGLFNGSGSGPVTIGTGATLTSLGNAYINDFQGVISGGGSFSIGAGVQGLSGNNTYSGGTTVLGGAELFVGSDTALGTGTVTFDNSSEFSPDVDVTIANPIVLVGGEALDNDDGGPSNMTLTGVISESGSPGSITWCTTGTLTLTNSNTFTGGVDMRLGNLVLANNSAAGSGIITLDTSSSLDVMSGVTTTNPLNFTGTAAVLTGSGTIASPVVANSGVVIDPAASPGNGPGTLTFSSGLTLASGTAIHFDIYDATGVAGTGYSLISATGGLNLTASANSITFNVVSTDASGIAAPAVNFSGGSPFSWTFASSTTAITGFNANEFQIVDSGFQNSIGAGFFSVSEVGNNLELNFTPVPEPSTWCLVATGAALLTGLVVRRNRVLRA
ncbi:MAG TPA: autotransporter-associated beta strand repeat-containing protein [Opitutaceae bacterium]|jgi:autotransporter-associated beta strand protein|nr:autotransporter-associated beta strand repeat-containing protein [Opitutaceae bacterium]